MDGHLGCFQTFHSRNLLDHPNDSFLQNFLFCSFLWKPSSELPEGRRGKEGRGRKKECSLSPGESLGWAVPGEELRQAQGRDQKPLACHSCPSPDHRVPESEYPRGIEPGCPCPRSLTITYTSKPCGMWSWDSQRDHNEMLPCEGGGRIGLLRIGPCRHLQKPAEEHQGWINTFLFYFLPSHHHP